MTDMQRGALHVLAEVWQLSPDVRLGQLMAHLEFLGQTYLGKSLAYIDDDELVAILYRHRAELQDRSAPAPNQLPPLESVADVSVSGNSVSPEVTAEGMTR